MLLRQIFDEKLAQYAYLVGCQQTGEALLIDPERDVDRYIELAEREELRIVAVTETHIHADFLSGARELAERLDLKLYLSDEGDADWKYEWVKQKKQDGADYDYVLLKHGDTFSIGNIEVKAVHTPGHTPEHLSFMITDYGSGADLPMGMMTGDFVFVGDLGRPDLLESAAGIQGRMEPSARTLYGSVQGFLQLPDYLQVWPAHGAGSACGKALGAVPESTVGYERRFNAAIDAARRGEDVFVEYILEGQPEPPLYFARMKRDNKLGVKILGALPQPRRLTAQELGTLAGRLDVAVLDTRIDRSAFMAGHLPGSLYAPIDKTFNTIAGSYVEEDTPLYLIIEPDRVEEAVRDLVRIGLDEVVGYATPETLGHYHEAGGERAMIPEIGIAEMEALRSQDVTAVLDVRRLAEYEVASVPEAFNIAHTRLLVRKEELSQDKVWLVHCRTGTRAAAASALLARFGYDVRYVNGLFEDWVAVGRDTANAQAVKESVG